MKCDGLFDCIDKQLTFDDAVAENEWARTLDDVAMLIGNGTPSDDEGVLEWHRHTPSSTRVFHLSDILMTAHYRLARLFQITEVNSPLVMFGLDQLASCTLLVYLASNSTGWIEQLESC